MTYVDQITRSLGIHAPNLITALIVLVVGWILALVISSLVKKALERTTWDERIASKAYGDTSKRVEASKWISRIVYYLLLLFVFIAFLQILGLTTIIVPLNEFLNVIFAWLPRILAAIVLAAIAWLVAYTAKRIVLAVLKATGVDERISGTAEMQQKEVPVSRSVAEAIYWLVLLLFLPMILDVLGIGGLLAPIQLMLAELLGFLPNLFAAAIILIIGWFVARILRRIVTNLLLALGSESFSERVGLSKALGEKGLAGLIGLLVYILVLIPVLLAALQALELEAITMPVSNMLNQMLNALPLLLAAALILAIAYILGKILADLVVNLLTAMGFDSILQRLGLNVETTGRRTPSQMVGVVVLAAVMLFAIIEAARILDFFQIADLFTEFMIFAGHVILGLIVFAIGIYLGNLAYNAVISSGIDHARLLAQTARIAIFIFAGAVGLRQMGIANEIINLAFGLLLGAIAVAVALAFGLGGREAASREIENWRESIKSEEP